jgi:hypothetical protein
LENFPRFIACNIFNFVGAEYAELPKKEEQLGWRFFSVGAEGGGKILRQTMERKIFLHNFSDVGARDASKVEKSERRGKRGAKKNENRGKRKRKKRAMDGMAVGWVGWPTAALDGPYQDGIPRAIRKHYLLVFHFFPLDALHFFFQKKKTDEFFCDSDCASGEFFCRSLLFSVFRETLGAARGVRDEKKGGKKHTAQQRRWMATTIRSFSAFALLFLIKNIVLRRKMSFFSNVFIIAAKKLLSTKMGSNFFSSIPSFCLAFANASPRSEAAKKHISAIKKCFLLAAGVFLRPSSPSLRK